MGISINLIPVSSQFGLKSSPCTIPFCEITNIIFHITVSFNFEGSGDDEAFNLSNEELMPLTKIKSINSVLPKEKARKNISSPIRNFTINLKKKSHRSNVRYYDLCRHARCGHNCHVNNNNVQCSCRKGFELHADGKSCKDIDECQHFNGGCEQLCVNNVGSYYCECREHYQLRENSKVSCEAFCSPPCLNNGECIGPNMCSCPPGYLLPRCSRMSICNPPCANGGICKRHNICKCPENYSGPTCLIALCKSNCLNGGRCVAPNVCQCPFNYFGETCQKALCTPACENGGTCIAINQCVCKPGFKGLRCQAEIAFSETGPCTALQTSLAEASHPTLRNCRPPCQNDHRCTLGNKCICKNAACSTKCQHRHCPIVTFTSKVTRMVRIRVTETFLSDCNTSLKQKCINYRLVEKVIPKTFYKLGYKLRCS